MDTTRTARTTSPSTRLEMRWSLRHARGRAGTLIAEWVVVDADDQPSAVGADRRAAA